MLKPIKNGLKSIALCWSKSGYLFSFDVHTGKDIAADGSAYETVMRMLRDSGMMMDKRLLMDYHHDVANLKTPQLRPRYSRKKEYHSCECGKICKFRITYGVQHKKPKALRFLDPASRAN
jgi:hypothetical protein